MIAGKVSAKTIDLSSAVYNTQIACELSPLNLLFMYVFIAATLVGVVYDLKVRFSSFPGPTSVIIPVHATCGMIAVVLGPLQFFTPLRKLDDKRWHRIAGYAYVFCMLGVILTATALIPFEMIYPLELYGLANVYYSVFLWAYSVTTLAMAYTSIRRGDWRTHRRWMFRNYVIGLALPPLFVTVNNPWITNMAPSMENGDYGELWYAWASLAAI